MKSGAEGVGLFRTEFLFMNGLCYKFALILRHFYPNGLIMYSISQGHVYFKLNNLYYDIRGVHYKVPNDIEVLNHHVWHKPHRWGRKFKIEEEINAQA